MMGAPARILFVDDEQRVLTAMRAMFRRDYEVHIANSGAEALAILRDHAIDVVVSDQRMPEMTGVEVLREAREIAPEAMRILLTGYADLTAIEDAINESEVFRYLMKPCPREQLKETLALAVDAVRASAVVAAELAGPQVTERDDTGRDDTEPDRIESGTIESGIDSGIESRRGGTIEPLAGAGRDGAAVVPAVIDPDAPVELLVLSTDDALHAGVVDAVGSHDRVRRARAVDEAITMLAERPAGVLVTDAGIDEQAIEALIGELRVHVPELVTIVASERSDAHMMINLINHGQVFRFLIKPLSVGQCRIWLSSAVNRHRQLLARPDISRRYATLPQAALAGSDGSLVGNLVAGVRNLRSRLGRFARARA